MSQEATKSQKQIQSTSAENDAYSFHLLLLSDTDDACELWLPKTAEGFWRFSNELQHRFLSISAKDGQWIASCKKPAFFKDVSMAYAYDMPLQDNMVTSISAEERNYLLLVAKAGSGHNVFHNYSVNGDLHLMIGNGPKCHICYDGPCMSAEYAVLSRVNGQWRIRSLNHTYGVYINNVQSFAAELKLGDVVNVMGLKIIVGPAIVSVNGGMGDVTVHTELLQPMEHMNGNYSRYYDQNTADGAERYFHRAPRKRRETLVKPITVEGPPLSMNQKKMPMLLRMGGSMVMGGASALAGNFMMLITSVLFPFMSSRYTEKQQQEYEHDRLRKDSSAMPLLAANNQPQHHIQFPLVGHQAAHF